MPEDKTIEALYALREEITGIIDAKIEKISGTEVGDVERKKIELLKVIYDAGGTVDEKTFLKIGKKIGYHPSGLGGLFAWKEKGATLQKIKKVKGEEIFITPKGVERLKSGGYLDEGD